MASGGGPEAVANLYSDPAETIAARLTGTTPDPLAFFFPSSNDDLCGVRFGVAVVQSRARRTAPECS